MSSPHTNGTMSAARLCLVIFLAGFTFLVYEVCWQRQLSLVLGATVASSTIVLASFMAGFGLGAVWWGRMADRRRSSRPLLAGLFLGTGLMGLIDYWLFLKPIPALYRPLAEAGFSTEAGDLVVFVFSGLLLMIPSFMMGGIFPIISRLLIAPGRPVATSLGRLYAWETAGSTLGGLAAGFWLLGFFGQMHTVLMAVAINLILCVLFITSRAGRLSTTPKDATPASDSGTSTTARTAAPGRSNRDRRAALVGAFTGGFVILGLQVLWIRIFRIYLTNTSYSFALIASVAILGLFIGSLLFRRFATRINNLGRAMVFILSSLALCSAASLALLVYLPEILMLPFGPLLADPTLRVFVLPTVAALVTVLPPTICSGFAFPLACRLNAAGRSSIGGDIGQVLLTNTAGSVVGPLVALFVLLPSLGVVLAAMVLVLITVLAGLFIGHSFTRLVRFQYLQYAALVGLAVVILMRPEIRILPPSFVSFDRETLEYRETVEGTLSVGKDPGATGARYTFVNNAAVIGSSYDAIKVVKMVGHFPFFLGLGCRRVLVIGFGIGVTTSAIATHSEVESIDCVELVPGLTEAAHHYRELNHDVVNDPRLNLIPGDGRHFLQRTGRKYDLISCDPTHPILGSGNLYTREYFELCRNHLNPGGMVSQYLPLHKLRTRDLMGIIATFHSAFPHTTIWLGHYHAVLLGSSDPPNVSFDDWSRRIAAIGDDPHFYSNPYHLAATLIFDGGAIGRLTDSLAINTDDLSYTEFFAPACLEASNLPENLRYLSGNRVGIGEVFDNVGDSDQMARFVRGNLLLSQSLYHRLGGDIPQSLQLLQRAVRENPEDQEFPLLLQLYRR